VHRGDLGIGAETGHQPHRKPITRVPTEASGWRWCADQSRGLCRSLGSRRRAIAGPQSALRGS
jgi:hypothetical protein